MTLTTFEVAVKGDPDQPLKHRRYAIITLCLFVGHSWAESAVASVSSRRRS